MLAGGENDFCVLSFERIIYLPESVCSIFAQKIFDNKLKAREREIFHKFKRVRSLFTWAGNSVKKSFPRLILPHRT